MSQDSKNELKFEEREALRSLIREKDPPAFLEERVVAALKESKLIRPSVGFWQRRPVRIGAAVAAALLIFGLGAVIGMNWTQQIPSAHSTQFMLVLRTGTESSTKSSEEVMRIIREYGSWARELNKSGVRVDGEKLKNEARRLREVDGQVVSAADSTVDESTVNGYFVIEAPNYDQAVKLASGCPHLKYGGTIEVRQIDQF